MLSTPAQIQVNIDSDLIQHNPLPSTKTAHKWMLILSTFPVDW